MKINYAATKRKSNARPATSNLYLLEGVKNPMHVLQRDTAPIVFDDNGVFGRC
jgi:hypothetical protein